MKFKQMMSNKCVVYPLIGILIGILLLLIINYIATNYLTGGIKINETNFPDPYFRKIVSREFDKNHNGCLSSAERKVIDLSFNTSEQDSNKRLVEVSNITCLSGIEFFTNLETIDISGLEEPKIDLSKNMKLIKITAEGCKSDSINLNGLINLEELDCLDATFKNLDLKTNVMLKKLICGKNLTKLELGENRRLQYLQCSQNFLETLDLSGNENLTYVDCSDGELKQLILTKNNKLEKLYCAKNYLENIDVSKCTNLKELNIINNPIKEIELYHNPNLYQLKCSSAVIIKGYKNMKYGLYREE